MHACNGRKEYCATCNYLNQIPFYVPPPPPPPPKNDDFAKGLFLSVCAGVLIAGTAGAAGIALLPAIAPVGSPALMGVNLLAGGVGSGVTYCGNGNIVDVNYSNR